MIIEDEREQDVSYAYEGMGKRVKPRWDDQDQIRRFLQVHRQIQDRSSHDQLRDDLVEELWKFHGQHSH